MSTPSKSQSCCGPSSTSKISWPGGRVGLIATAVGLGSAALWFGWPWLVLAGIAPVLVAIAPCLIMCGVMCAMHACCKPKKEAAAETGAAMAAPAAEPANATAIPQFSSDAVQAVRPAGNQAPAKAAA